MNKVQAQSPSPGYIHVCGTTEILLQEACLSSAGILIQITTPTKELPLVHKFLLVLSGRLECKSNSLL